MPRRRGGPRRRRPSGRDERSPIPRDDRLPRSGSVVNRPPVLAIDGPAGTGKTTSAREVAHRLGFVCIDSGALYRAIALVAREAGIEEAEEDRLAPLLREAPIRVEIDADRLRVFLDGEEETARLRDPDVTSLASTLAVSAAVRDAVGRWLRELAGRGPAVVEGRDIGTAVFPDADLKIFLTATPEERALRR
ncbi:MAG: (d)CMP kinase, partial [Candidatus Eisenbacteria bacterium]|nr:(d)CMP kinase [Candidatus Latescibacterota bacterium]MBD3302923.1 (d)CMP kinase [Candidatus Eisenbacteria bacterium]